jgi:biopolymer transport protein ExbD
MRAATQELNFVTLFSCCTLVKQKFNNTRTDSNAFYVGCKAFQSFIMNIKYFLLLFMVFSFLTSNAQESGIKELDLMLPKATKEDFPSTDDYKHSIELNKEWAILTLNGKKQRLSYDLISETFKSNKELIRSKVFSIITHHETSYQTVVDILDLLAKNKIERYKLLTTPDTPIRKQAPQIKPSDTDSSFFRITLLEHGYGVNFLNQVTEFKDKTALDLFISKNKSKVDSAKVLIDGATDVKYDTFKPLLEVLKKHELYRFKMAAHD